MTDPAGEGTSTPTTPEPPAVEEDWFKQIPFDPRKGLNAVLPLQVPELLPRTEAAADHGGNR